MTAILLIADSERVQRIFADLESKGALQLHAAATLDQVDLQLKAALPAFTFVQSRISGLSNGILLRHLKKALPETSQIIFLSGDGADLAANPPLGVPLIDLRFADDMLAETVTGFVTGAAPSIPALEGKGAAKQKGQTKKAPRRGKEARRRAVKGREEKLPDSAEPSARLPLQDVEVSSAVAAMVCHPPVDPLPAGTPEGPEPLAPPSFVEIMAAASAQRELRVSFPLDPEGLNREGDAIHQPQPAIPATEAVQPAEPPEPDRVPGEEGIVPLEDPVEGSTQAYRKSNKSLWLLVLLSAFSLIPAAAYLLGRVSSGPEQETRQERSIGPTQRAALSPAATSATVAASPPASDTTPEGTRNRQIPQVSGLATLPPFLEGVEADAGYRERHPGWERYIGAKAEYRLFREDGRYRAIQAIARGNHIPDGIFRRVLLEFGGIAGYVVKSVEQKGEYLVEQAAASGSASLTIYRKRNDPRVKALVVYYR